MSFRRRAGLVGRTSECAALDRMIAALRTDESRALVVHGAPGVGKSALLEHLESSATGMRVLRAVGVESEMELATGNPEWHASLQRLFDDPGLHITSEPASYRVVVELHSS